MSARRFGGLREPGGRGGRGRAQAQREERTCRQRESPAVRGEATPHSRHEGLEERGGSGTPP